MQRHSCQGICLHQPLRHQQYGRSCWRQVRSGGRCFFNFNWLTLRQGVTHDELRKHNGEVVYTEHSATSNRLVLLGIISLVERSTTNEWLPFRVATPAYY